METTEILLSEQELKPIREQILGYILELLRTLDEPTSFSEHIKFMYRSWSLDQIRVTHYPESRYRIAVFYFSTLDSLTREGSRHVGIHYQLRHSVHPYEFQYRAFLEFCTQALASFRGYDYEEIDSILTLKVDAAPPEPAPQTEIIEIPPAESFVYEYIKFDSPPEIAIAKALDRKGILFIGNATMRLGTNGNRQNRRPDFLICHEGKWGILEVDGQRYHPPESATKDHDRRRLIERSTGRGLSYFDRFDAMRCMNDPDGVVAEFLEILAAK